MTTAQRKAAQKEWLQKIRQTAENDPRQRMQLAKKLSSLLKAWQKIRAGNDLWEAIAGYGEDGVSGVALTTITRLSQSAVSQAVNPWVELNLISVRKDGRAKMYSVNLETLMQLTNFEATVCEGETTIPDIIEKLDVLSLPLDFILYTRMLPKVMTVTEAMKSVNTYDQSRVSTTLARLRRVNLVSVEPEGTKRKYRSLLGILFVFDVAESLLVRHGFVKYPIIKLSQPEIKD